MKLGVIFKNIINFLIMWKRFSKFIIILSLILLSQHVEDQTDKFHNYFLVLFFFTIRNTKDFSSTIPYILEVALLESAI